MYILNQHADRLCLTCTSMYLELYCANEFFPLIQTDKRIRLKYSIRSHTATVIRELITVHRLCQAYKEETKGTVLEPPEPSVIANMDLGFHTVMGGEGSMCENFKRNRTLGQYSGHGINPKLPEDPLFTHSHIRELKFHHCFKKTRQDITQRN